MTVPSVLSVPEGGSAGSILNRQNLAGSDGRSTLLAKTLHARDGQTGNGVN
jgi:hypothetical protein